MTTISERVNVIGYGLATVIREKVYVDPFEQSPDVTEYVVAFDDPAVEALYGPDFSFSARLFEETA